MLDAVLALNETDTQVFDFASQAAPPADMPSDHILVPDAHLLFNGEFKRVGTTDLKIVGDDGASFFIRDYFTSDKASHLISPEGATLSASVVAALAGPLAPGQSAQAGAQQAGQPVIGRVDAMSGSCTVIRNGVSVALNSGDTVRKGDVVQTASGSAVAIVFADGSTFSLNANARMVLDDFVYNAGGTGNSALISLVQGTFSFVAGQVAKTGDMRVDTPVATMGIRGTAVLVEISANDGQTRFSVMTEPDGTTGSFNLYDKTSGSLIGTVNSSQIGWLVTPAGPLQVVAQQVQKTPAQLQQEFNIIQQIFTIFNNNQQNPFVPDQQQDPNRRGDNPNDPNPQTAQGSGGGSGSATGATPSDTSPLTPLQQNQQTNTTVTVTPVSNPPLPDSTQGGGGSDPTNGQDPSQPLPTGQFTIINGSGNITGTEGNDHIFGSGTSDAINALGGDDEVFAGGGNDTIVGGHGEGNDFYDGGDGHDAITFNSANGMTFTLNATNEQSTAVGATTGTDILINIEEIVASPGNDLIILNKASDWTIDAGAGTDTVRLANGLDLDFTTTTGPNAAGNLHLSNFEILDLATDTAQNVIRVDFSDLSGIDNESGMPLRILGGTGGEGGAVDVIEITNLQGLGGKLQLIGTYTDPVDAGVSDPFKDHATDGVTFDVYRYVVDGIVVNTFYVEHGMQVTTPGAQDDFASMTENQVLFVDALANDFAGTSDSKTLTDLGEFTITAPGGVTLGTPAIVIEDNKIRITPGTAFDALAAGETATIRVPYTMVIDDVTYNAVATITVTGTNDAPHFSFLPEGLDRIGTTHSATFGGVEALQLVTEGATQSQIEQFLGLSAGTLDSIEGDTTDGAAVAFDLTLAQNETVSFSWNFASTEYEPFNDYAFFSVSSNTAIRLSDIYTIGDSINDGYLHSSGWQQFTFTANTTAQYRFGIGVMNEGDTAFDSNLYISGFSGLGFKRTTTESGQTETFNLLNGAYDPDTNDTLSATNVALSGKDHLGNAIQLPSGAVAINGNSVTIDPKFFSYLTAGQSISVIVNYDLTDGHTTTHNSATLIVNGEGAANALPAISIAHAGIYDTGSSTTLFGVEVSDANHTTQEQFEATISSQHGIIELREPITDYPQGHESVSFTGTLEQINQVLQGGVTYYDQEGGEAGPNVDIVKLTIEDSHGGKDSLNFIFNIHGTPGVNLSGTAEKDVLLGTSHGETLTGGAGADTFVFSAETFKTPQGGMVTVGPGSDVITDFAQGQDKIALYNMYDNYEVFLQHTQITQQNGSTVIDMGDGNSLTLQNFTGALSQNDFIFHAQNGNLFA